jgi:polyhydroxyalkanoate synthesis regulator phasin
MKTAKAKKTPAKKALSMDSVNSYVDDLRKQLGGIVEDSRSQTMQRTYHFAHSLLGLQRSTFDNAFKLITKVQERSEKLVDDQIATASWMPKEGKDVVREWSRTLREGRSEFQKTVDKSYDLLMSYFARIEKQEQKELSSRKSPPKTKVAAAKKRAAAAKKKAPAKRAAKTLS